MHQGKYSILGHAKQTSLTVGGLGENAAEAQVGILYNLFLLNLKIQGWQWYALFSQKKALSIV